MACLYRALPALLPGLALSLATAVAAVALAHGERLLFGAVWLEPLVLAILAGAAIRAVLQARQVWPARLAPGIDFSARFLLELAIVLLGASVDTHSLVVAGPGLLAGIAGVVVLSIAGGYAIGRALGLPHRLATLVACGNAICGNSAIAAVAPVIGALGEDVAASIAFTAVLGVGVVLTLPLLAMPLHLPAMPFGVLAGMTVYAVPQVFAAAAPAGVLAVQAGTIVKLTRVMMLGPVVLALSLAGGKTMCARQLHRLVPWFIVGFLALCGARAAGGVPPAWLAPMADASGFLTNIAMAALGLSTNLQAVRGAGLRVSAAVTLSLALLAILSVGLIHATVLHQVAVF